MENKSSKPLSIAALVCGIVGIISFFATLPALGMCAGSATNVKTVEEATNTVRGAVATMVIFPLIGLILSVLGIIFGAVGMKNAKLNNESRGLAIGGLVTGIIGTVFSGIATLCSLTACGAASTVL